MAAEGVELLADLSDLAVMGFAEVARHLPFFLRLRTRVFRALEHERVDMVLPIDYPGFNLRLAARARELRIPVLYYIAPQVWAWHASRVRKLIRDTDAVAVVLPFEEAYLRGAGVDAHFVGHPLLDAPTPSEDRDGWFAGHGLDPERPLLALFPGSRAQEVERHLELFSRTADLVLRRRPEVQPVIGAAADLDPRVYDSAPWPCVSAASGLLRHASAALVKSGTTTLEAALAGTPFVVAYRMNPLSFAIAQRLVRVPHIALANLVAEERVAPEFVQGEATPPRLADALLPLLDPASPRRRTMVEELAGVRARLGGGGAAERVTELAASLLRDPR